MFRHVLSLLMITGISVFLLHDPLHAEEKESRIPGHDACVRAGIESEISNLAFEPASLKLQDRDAESFAGAFPVPQMKIRWSPQLLPGSFTARRLLTASISSDLSALILTERTGAENGPFGTRFILVDSKNLCILKVFELPFDIACLAAGNGTELWCSRNPQADFDKGGEICIVDALTGNITGTIKTEIRQFTPDLSGRTAFAVGTNNMPVRLQRDGTVKKWFECEDVLKVSASPDKKKILFSGDKTAFVADVRGNILLEFPAVPASVIYGGDDRLIVSFCAPDGVSAIPQTIRIYEKNGSRDLTDDSSGKMAMDRSGKYLYVVRVKGDAAKYDLATGELIRFTNLKTMHPTTRGGVQAVFPGPVPDSLTVLEPSGELYHIDTSKKRWKKYQVSGTALP